MDPSNRDSVERQNERLREQYREIARLSGALAHEIKNPLSTIRLNMELLAEDFAAAESPRERRALGKIEVMQRECLRLQGLLDDFLNFSKVRQIHLEPIDLNQVLDEVLDFFAPQAEAADIEVIRYLDPDLPRVMLDRDAFRGALLNLLLNAQQAMPAGGQLVVHTTSSGNIVELHLIDTGCGMDDKTAAQIFDAFYTTKPGGSGLGLPTAGKIIDAHGGRIMIQSELGRGTKCTIELPVPARLTAASSADGGAGTGPL